MAAEAGRNITFGWGTGSPQPEIAGVREKGVSLAGEAIDVSSDENNGWRTLLALAAENQVEISLSGVTKDKTLKTDWFAGNRTKPGKLTYEDGGIIAGTFFLAEFSEKGSYKDAVTFEAKLMSSGVVTYTPGV